MPLSQKQTHHLKGLAHHLKPVVIVGQGGLHEGVLGEIDSALTHHELIKVKIAAAEKQTRRRVCGEIATHSRAELVLSIGSIAVFYRANPKRKSPILLPT